MGGLDKARRAQWLLTRLPHNNLSECPPLFHGIFTSPLASAGFNCPCISITTPRSVCEVHVCSVHFFCPQSTKHRTSTFNCQNPFSSDTLKPSSRTGAKLWRRSERSQTYLTHVFPWPVYVLQLWLGVILELIGLYIWPVQQKILETKAYLMSYNGSC